MRINEIRDLNVINVPGETWGMFGYFDEIRYLNEYLNKKYSKEIKTQFKFICNNNDIISINVKRQQDYVFDHEKPHENEIIFVQGLKKASVEYADEANVVEFKELKKAVPYIKIFHRKSTNTLIIVCERNHTKWSCTEEIRHIISFFLLYYNILNNKSITFEEEEKNFVKAFAEQDKQTIIDFIVNNFTRQTEPNKDMFEELLDCFKQRKKLRLDSLKSNLENTMIDIKNMEDRLRSIYSRRKTTLEAIEECMAVSGDEEIVHRLYDAINSTPNAEITSIDPNSGMIKLKINTFLTQFDPDKAKIIYDYGFTDHDFAKVYKEIFINEDTPWKIRTYAAFTLQMDGTISPDRRGARIDKNAIANPHIYYHGCLGGNGPAICDAVNNGNFDELIWLLIAATANVNLMESVTTNFLYGDMKLGYSVYENKETGEIVNYQQLIEILEEKESGSC